MTQIDINTAMHELSHIAAGVLHGYLNDPSYHRYNWEAEITPSRGSGATRSWKDVGSTKHQSNECLAAGALGPIGTAGLQDLTTWIKAQDDERILKAYLSEDDIGFLAKTPNGNICIDDHSRRIPLAVAFLVRSQGFKDAAKVLAESEVVVCMPANDWVTKDQLKDAVKAGYQLYDHLMFPVLHPVPDWLAMSIEGEYLTQQTIGILA